MKRSILTLVIITSIVLSLINTQKVYSFYSSKDDILIETTLDSLEYWIENDYVNKALRIVDRAEKLALESNNKKYIARVFRLRSGLSMATHDVDAVKDYLDKATILQKYVKDEYGDIQLNNLWGLYHKVISKNYDRSISFLERAIDLSQEYNYEEERIDILLNLATIYYIKQDWENCYEISKKTIALAHKYKKNLRLIYLYHQMGKVCSNTQRYEEALAFFEEGEKIIKQNVDSTKTNRFNQALYFAGIADVYNQKGEHLVANKFYKKYVEEQVKQNDYFLKKYSENLKDYRELQLKDKDNERILIENQYQQTQLKLNKYLMISGGVIIVILILLSLLQYKNSRLKTENNTFLRQKNKELLEAKIKVEQAFKQKTAFVNNITHELRTPLHAINGIAHLLEHKEPNENQRKKQLEILQFSGRYLLRFVNDIIELNTSDQSTKTRLKNQPLSIVKLIGTIKESLKFFIIRENNNVFEFDLDDKLSDKIMGDSDHLSRIIVSILSNASRYINGGVLRFSIKNVFSTDSVCNVLFSLKSKDLHFSKEKQEELNTILQENRSALFTALSDQSNQSTLELVIANKLLQQCDSRLVFTSSNKEGATFSFQIPFDKELEKTNQKEFYSKSNEEIKILVVEDNRINQLVTQKIITNYGYQCEIASDGYEALEMTDKNSYDLIFMDIMMDGIDGFETTKRIRKSDKETPIIALTAISESENKEHFINAGITKIINKPFEPVVLLEQIKIAISKQYI
ncbi:response regulator [Aquimarina sediminis]|uniref:response regulator n=1 Tax=Aquimarina sediminis TaxID=2070536 RepID=UPI000CA07E67|nr:response regulator [Aquimarina sediminis]